MSKCLWSGWKWYRGLREIASLFPYCPMNRECSWKKTQLEKKTVMKIMNSSSYLRGFANNCYKIVSPFFLQESVHDFAICEHSSGTLLLVEDEPLSQGVGRISNCQYEKGNCLLNSLKARPVTPKRNRFF